MIQNRFFSGGRFAAFFLAVLILLGGAGQCWPVDLDEAPALALEPFLPPIELDAAAFDLARVDRRILCLAVSDKSAFLLKSSGRRWVTLDVIQPGGSAVSAGFLEIPPVTRKKDPIRFFVSSVQKDRRILTTFYASSNGKTKIEAEGSGRIYRRDGPVLFSQKSVSMGSLPTSISAELPKPGGLPRVIGALSLPKGTGLFDFVRLSDMEEGLTVRIEEDGEIGVWSRETKVSGMDLNVGQPPAPPNLPEALRWRIPPVVADVDGDGTKEVVVALNDPDQSGGFFSRSERHRSQVVCLTIGSGEVKYAGKAVGATPIQKAAITALALLDDDVIVAAVDTEKRRTQLHRLRKTDETGSKEGRRAEKF